MNVGFLSSWISDLKRGEESVCSLDIIWWVYNVIPSHSVFVCGVTHYFRLAQLKMPAGLVKMEESSTEFNSNKPVNVLNKEKKDLMQSVLSLTIELASQLV